MIIMSRNMYALMAVSVMAVLMFGYIVYDSDSNDSEGYSVGDFATFHTSETAVMDRIAFDGYTVFTGNDDIEFKYIMDGTHKYELISKDGNTLEFLVSVDTVGRYLMPDPVDQDLFIDLEGFKPSNSYLIDENTSIWVKSYNGENVHVTETLYCDEPYVLSDSNVSAVTVNIEYSSHVETGIYRFTYSVESGMVVSVDFACNIEYTTKGKDHLFVYDNDEKTGFLGATRSFGYPVTVTGYDRSGPDYEATIGIDPETGLEFSYVEKRSDIYRHYSEYLVDTNLNITSNPQEYENAIYSFNEISELNPGDDAYDIIFPNGTNGKITAASHGTLEYTILDLHIFDGKTVYTVKTDTASSSYIGSSGTMYVSDVTDLSGFTPNNGIVMPDGSSAYIWTKTISDMFGVKRTYELYSDRIDAPNESSIFRIIMSMCSGSSDDSIEIVYEVNDGEIDSAICSTTFSSTTGMDDHPFIAPDTTVADNTFTESGFGDFPLLIHDSGLEPRVIDGVEYSLDIKYEDNTNVITSLTCNNDLINYDFNMYLIHTTVDLKPVAEDGTYFVYLVTHDNKTEYQMYAMSDSTKNGFTMTSYLMDEDMGFTIVNKDFGDDGSVRVSSPYNVFFAFAEGMNNGTMVDESTVRMQDGNIVQVRVWEYVFEDCTYRLYENNCTVFAYIVYKTGAAEPYASGLLQLFV